MKITVTPTLKQHEAWEALKTHREVFFGGGAGGGKAQPLDCLLWTDKGSIKMGDVKVGDKIYGLNGFVNVIAIHPRGFQECYEIEFIDGSKTKCTGDHLWTFWQARKKGRGLKTESTLKLIERLNKGKNYITPLADEIEFEVKEQIINPYLVGVLLGNGCLLKDTPTITCPEPEMLTYIDCDYTKASNEYDYYLTGIANKVKKIGIAKCSSLNKKIPDNYKYGSLEQRFALIQGLMDTDGTVDKRGHLSYCTISEQLANDVQFVVRSLGGKATITKKPAGYKKDGVYIPCNDAYEVYIGIKDSKRLLRLKRKKDRCVDTFNGGNFERGRRIISIKSCGVEKVQCITVDNKDGLYLTDDFIVTHNSWWLCETRLVNAYLYPGYKSFIGREELKRLMSSTYITWTKVCAHHKVPHTDWKLNGHYNFIEFKNSSRIDLLDLKYLPSDPLYERFGSLEFTDGAIEECGEINFLAKDVVSSRIGRHRNDEFGLSPTLAMTGNPKKNWTYRDYYKPWKDGILSQDLKFIQSLYYDNKYTAKDYKSQLENIRDTTTKERLMFGNWDYDSDPNAMISYDKIAAIWTNDHVPSGSKYIICDVARYGSDSAIITVWDGYRLVEYKTFAISSTVEIQNCINALRQKYQVPASNCVIDEDGVGGGIVDQIKGCSGFVNNSKAIDATYFNLKTECGYKLAENIYKIFIACDVPSTVKDKIEQEIGQLKTYDADKDGKLKILPKEKIKENIGRSPDWLDIFTMRMYPEIKPNYKPAKFNF